MSNNKDVVRQIFEDGWNAGKMEVFDQCCAKEMVGSDPILGKINVEDLKQLVRSYRTAFPDLRMQISNTVSEADYVCVQWRSTGRHSGDLFGTPASGKSATVEGITVSRLKNGKIIESHTQFDALGMLQQVGIVPKLDLTKMRGAQRPEARA